MGVAPRLAVLFLIIGALCLPPPAIGQVASHEDVIVVSRARILTETEAAVALRTQERAARERLQEWIKIETEALDREEQRLTGLRPETPSEEFERQTSAFDQRVRQVRRTAQRLEASITAQFRDARKNLVTELYPVLIEVLQRESATLIIDADQILIADPEIEKTDEVIALFNERVELPAFERIEFPALSPLAPATPQTPETE
ncbi:MAG: OmpH family outer membrane protein [Pseudomonadota bacterium]